MASPGSYFTQKRNPAQEEPEPQVAAGQILKLLGQQQPRSFVDLLLATGWSQGFLKAVTADLSKRGLVEGNDERLTLTSLGFRAQYIVAT